MYGHYCKRLIDLLLTLFVSLLFFPLLIFIALLVRIVLGSPIFFRQERIGLHGRSFTLLKFRSMLNSYDLNGNLLRDEKRLNSFGSFLRESSLDELPELFNVLKGDMSLVGPRPLLPKYQKLYTPHQFRRHEVRQGITGWAQINGRNALSWEKKFELDVWYVDHLSFWLDMKILLLTLWMIIKREGINQQGKISAEEFVGNKNQ